MNVVHGIRRKVYERLSIPLPPLVELALFIADRAAWVFIACQMLAIVLSIKWIPVSVLLLVVCGFVITICSYRADAKIKCEKWMEEERLAKDKPLVLSGN